MKRLGLECVYLDITHKSSEQIEEHFPTVKARCAELGLDIAQERIPVVPAAHYTCGGVVVDQHGATDVQGLYVIGETACTGLMARIEWRAIHYSNALFMPQVLRST